MMHPDRKTPPALLAVDHVEYREAEKIILPNGLPVYVMRLGSQEILRLEFIFSAGTSSHPNPLVPSMANGMLQEGTRKHSAAQIADGIDRYGAFLELDFDKDFASLTLYTLRRYFSETLNWIVELLTESTFPEREWEIMQTNKLEKYRINCEKVSFLAGKHFQELILSGTPYGAAFGEEEYLGISIDELRTFRDKHYNLSEALILLCGWVDDDALSALAEALKHVEAAPTGFQTPNLPAYGELKLPSKHYIEKQDAIQSAIRIGRRLFTRHHADYFPMKVLSTVLGGYFGSRLMSNIREDKGYTYGIGAGALSYVADGWFYISTEVGADVTNAALREIYHEIKLLREDLIPEEELDLVKNYMLGGLLKSFDGTFEKMERFKGNMLYNLPPDYYSRYTEAILSAKSVDLRDLANRWFLEEDLTELVVGKRKG